MKKESLSIQKDDKKKKNCCKWKISLAICYMHLFIQDKYQIRLSIIVSIKALDDRLIVLIHVAFIRRIVVVNVKLPVALTTFRHDIPCSHILTYEIIFEQVAIVV